MKKYAFTARIQAGMGGGAGVLSPFDVKKEFGTEGKVPVQETFDGARTPGRSCDTAPRSTCSAC